MPNFKEIKSVLDEKKVTLVAVSKTKSPEQIQRIYNQGQRIFGENRVQELREKYELMPKDIEWHLIGHLQKNKVKYIAPFVAMIHSIDDLDLLNMVDKKAEQNSRKIEVLLQFKIAKEESKFGLVFDDFNEDFNANDYSNIVFRGVMGMATFTDIEEQIREEFALLRSIKEKLKTKFFQNHDGFDQISMGMSGDYLIAIDEGSTMVRIGSLIFGVRLNNPY